MRYKFSGILVAGILSAAFLSGCTGNPESVVAAPNTAASAAESGDELQSVLESGVLNVGVEGTYPPYTYHDEAGNLTGFDVDVAKAIAGRLGVEVQFTESEWDSLLAGIDSGRLNTVINAVSITPERAEKYDFAGPYFYVAQQVVVQSGNEEIRSWEDLAGKRVATSITSTTADIFEEAGAEVVPVNTADEAALLVTSGRADFCGFNELVLNNYLENHPEADLEVAFAVPGVVDSYAVPVRKGEERFLEAIEHAIEALREDGTLTQISEQYFGTDYTQPVEEGGFDSPVQQQAVQPTLFVNGTELNVTWEDNETVQALKEALRDGDITVETHQYGGFEQVGSLPQTFVRNDVQMRTEPGDIVLYGGNSVVLFYGSNSWTYTKLGHIENLSADELHTLLSGETVQAVFRLK